MAIQNRRETKGRHPLLKVGSLASRVFLQLKQGGDQTIRQVADTLLEEYQSVNAQIQRMKGEGLIIEVPKQKGNRTVKAYQAVVENETGFARDKVSVEVTFYVNEFGEYSAIAKVVNELPTAREDNPRPIHRATFYAAVPKPNEPLKTREIWEGLQTSHAKNLQPLIIDLNEDDYKQK
jgi:hypothetical protein